ncbi:hypothetical protein L6452_46835 [Arctium lappa]|nr:hypothetical protein L6452_46835 [Arctium lappa]
MCKCRSHGNLSPLRPSKFSFEYLLLPPRSAPTAAPPGLTPKVSAQFGTVTPASGSSRIASSAYQKWPTWSSRFRGNGSTKQPRRPTYLKFENRSRAFAPHAMPLIIRFTR